jgi:hypothetical protein
MKIEEVPIKAAEEELRDARCFTTGKYLELVERMNDLDKGSALVVKCADKRETFNLAASMQGYNNRTGKRFLVNSATKTFKVFIRRNNEEKPKKKS